MELYKSKANLAFANELFYMAVPIKYEIKNKLYFNKFEYKAVCSIQGAAYTYYTPDLETFVSRMEKLRDLHSKGNKPIDRFGIRTMDQEWTEYWEEVNVDQISQFLTWRNTVKKEKCMIRIQGDSVSFFSNDLHLLETLVSIDHKVSFYQAHVLGTDTIYFAKTPKYKYRTFFKGKRCNEDFYQNVLEFSQRYPNTKVSKGLISYAQQRKNAFSRYMYLHGSYHVDYNDPGMLTILHMLFPSMIAKTYSLDKRP